MVPETMLVSFDSSHPSAAYMRQASVDRVTIDSDNGVSPNRRIAII